MRLPRVSVYSLLAASVLLSLALRYPSTSHESGVDSFFIHNLTFSIVRTGNARWILNPLSLFGLFPVSYPSAGPFLLAGFSELSGIAVEPTVLLASLAYGAIGTVSSFSLAREFRRDDFFCVSVSFLYTFAPRFLSFTLWTGSMRGLFMAILPVFVLIALRSYRAPTRTNVGLLLLTLALLTAVHRLGVIMIALVVSGSVLAYIITILFRILRLRIPRVFLRSSYRRFSPYLALGAIVGISGVMFVSTDVLSSYSEGQLASGSSLGVELFNLGVSLGRSIGITLVFGVMGLLVLVRARNKTPRDAFLVVVFLGLVPTLFLRAYTGFYILPFVALLGGLALQWMSQRANAKTARTLVLVSLVAGILVSSAILHYEEDNLTTLSTETYSTAEYFTSIHGPAYTANDGLVGVRIASMCGCAYLPVGGAGTTFQGPELLVYNYFSPKEIAQNLTRVALSDLTLDSDSLWAVTSIQAESDWVKIMEAPYNSPSPELIRYHPVLYVENRNVGPNFYAYGNVYASLFAKSAHDGAYMIYQSPGESLYYINSQ